jgi:hypothetical protein
MIRGIPVYEGGFEATPVFVTAACDKDVSMLDVSIVDMTMERTHN